MQQQAGEHRDIRSGPQREMNVGNIASRRAPRIDHHDLGAAPFARRGKALIQHRMAPRRVTADEHHQIGKLDVLIAAGHDVFAESADVAGDRRRHAEPRVGVDIGAADESLHQLVGNVIILGEKLAGYVERDRIRTVMATARVMAAAMRSSASSQLALRPPICGCSNLPSVASVSPSAAPFEHNRPLSAG